MYDYELDELQTEERRLAQYEHGQQAAVQRFNAALGRLIDMIAPAVEAGEGGALFAVDQLQQMLQQMELLARDNAELQAALAGMFAAAAELRAQRDDALADRERWMQQVRADALANVAANLSSELDVQYADARRFLHLALNYDRERRYDRLKIAALIEDLGAKR